MNSEAINRWLTLGANIGVVIGLILVAYQIKQDSDLTKAVLFNDHTNSRKDWNQAMMGENPLAIVAKSVEAPDELTLEELMVMDMYLIGALNELRRLELLEQAGLEVDVSVEGLQFFYFGSNFAKAWYSEYGGATEMPTVNTKIAGVSPDWLVEFFGRVLRKVDSSSGQQLDRDSPR